MFMRTMNRQSSTQQVTTPPAPNAMLLLRLAIGFVFITEGIQKFLSPETLGAARFAKIGIPYPEIIGPAVGGIEIACGALVLIGLLTRLAALGLVVDMLVAIAATKVPILLGHSFWVFAEPVGATGFWAAAHEARLDIAMLFGSGLLASVGPGALSFDQGG
jgi:uncharacterized membrane protein YphA (DoxX/SURF4 family)